MSAWANLESSQDDKEIERINEIEQSLGELSEEIHKVRNLITRFEVCHFKYKLHIDYIIDSIKRLQPVTDPDLIGSTHLRHGDSVTSNDKTGRSKIGQQYVNALQFWQGNEIHNQDESQKEEAEEETQA